MTGFRHLPVLQEEVLHAIAAKPGGVYLDGTVGGGGHAALVLEASAPDGILIGLDRDPAALAAAGERLAPFANRFHLFHANFADMAGPLRQLHVAGLDGFLLDLGVSSHQLDTGERGFSFQQEAPLDMRMDTSGGRSAADLVNELPEEELARIIREYGEERWARRIAAFVVNARQKEPIRTTLQLVAVIKGAIPRGAWEERIHPATRTFQALRIAVNDELGSLERGLHEGLQFLNKGGRAVVISFHSLEDRIVKKTFRSLAQGCSCPKGFPRCVCGRVPQVRVLSGRPITAGEAEIVGNPRARSAKLRVAEKL